MTLSNAEFHLHWKARKDWPRLDSPDWLYMGRAVLALGEALYPEDWRDDDMFGSREGKRRYRTTRDRLVAWMVAGELPFGFRSPEGITVPASPNEWAGTLADPDLCAVWRHGTVTRYARPIDVAREGFQRLVDGTKTDQAAEEARSAIPLRHLEHANAWAQEPEVIKAAMELLRRTGDDGSSNHSFSKKRVARTLSVMWRDSGRMGGTAETFETYLKENSSYEEAKRAILARVNPG